MVEIYPGFDPTVNKVVIRVKTNLFEKYLPNFIGMVKENKSGEKLPKDLDIEPGREPLEAVLIFSLPKTASVSNIQKDPEDGQMSSGVLSIRKQDLLGIDKIIHRFVDSALRHELREIEFIPLDGYDFDLMQEEIQDAIKAKRRLCVVKTYKEYLDLTRNGKYELHQYMIEPDTDEYAELALMLFGKEVDKIREIYNPKLSLKEWI